MQCGCIDFKLPADGELDLWCPRFRSRTRGGWNKHLASAFDPFFMHMPILIQLYQPNSFTYRPWRFSRERKRVSSPKPSSRAPPLSHETTPCALDASTVLNSVRSLRLPTSSSPPPRQLRRVPGFGDDLYLLCTYACARRGAADILGAGGGGEGLGFWAHEHMTTIFSDGRDGPTHGAVPPYADQIGHPEIVRGSLAVRCISIWRAILEHYCQARPRRRFSTPFCRHLAMLILVDQI